VKSEEIGRKRERERERERGTIRARSLVDAPKSDRVLYERAGDERYTHSDRVPRKRGACACM